MSAKAYTLCTGAIVAALAALVGWSVAAEMPVILPLMGLVVAMVLIRICRRRTKEVIADERVERINEKAANISYRVFSIVAVVIALVLISLRESLPPAYGIIGETLAYSASGLMLIHLAFYYYYKSKY